MKAGFKPKLWTKREWLAADPSSKTKNCGVEAALDEWQKHCTAKFADMTAEACFQAANTAQKLSDAMTKASKQCDPKAQKETLMGIHEYKKRADDYCKFAKLATAALINRKKYNTAMINFAAISKDAGALAVFESYAKKQGLWPSVHTLQLFEQKKYEQAVRLYGGDGKDGGDYNIPSKEANILLDTFVNKVRHEKSDILAAISVCQSEQHSMLRDPSHYTRIKALPEWQALLSQNFPIKEYAV